ncbi:hypothetical protein [Shewanella pneumatophori]|uniref:Uncharacterized protein n=1 Tax=Shewanella pneumatophori TaxID=314092 RepID=A0A9X1ZJX0_9GAMM|nr:hypothetical protein [Shewanella pneumatophori]MCL1137376.1 hypothetical protein [Shewanella pneumatophori]
MNRVKIFHFLLSSLSIIGWSLAIYALMLFDKARPDAAIGYFQSHGAEVRLEWDPEQTVLLEHIIWVCAVLSFINLGFNLYIAQRSKLGWWVNIPLLFTCSLAAGLYIRFVV